MRHQRSRASSQYGLSLIELMVGITVGMIVTAGAGVLMINQLNEHRRLVLETQIQQDLRASAELIMREIRRAGSWGSSQNAVWTSASGFPAPMENPYSGTFSVAGAASSAVLTYSYSKNMGRSGVAVYDPEDNILSNNEIAGFRLDNHTLQFQLGNGNWQPMTDPAVLTVTSFNVVANTQNIGLGAFCEVACPAGAANCPPTQAVTTVTVNLSGQATHDAAVTRSIAITSRVRNEQVTGSCPS